VDLGSIPEFAGNLQVAVEGYDQRKVCILKMTMLLSVKEQEALAVSPRAMPANVPDRPVAVADIVP
jgi:hypothetical protein